MTQPMLNILMWEENAADAERIVGVLHSAGFPLQARRVTRLNDLLDALTASRPDIIFSDHSLPRINGFEALALVRHMDPGIPFVFVVGAAAGETGSARARIGCPRIS